MLQAPVARVSARKHVAKRACGHETGAKPTGCFPDFSLNRVKHALRSKPGYNARPARRKVLI